MFEVWRGFCDEEFDGIFGVLGFVFVYVVGFIGGNNIFDGVFVMV